MWLWPVGLGHIHHVLRGNYRKILLTASLFREVFLLALNRSPRLDGCKINKGRVARFTPHRADTQIALNGETAAG